MTPAHVCPAPGCTESVPYSQLACRGHWFALPKPMRDDVWRAYRNGGPGSPGHTEAIDAAIAWLEENAPAR